LSFVFASFKVVTFGAPPSKFICGKVPGADTPSTPPTKILRAVALRFCSEGEN
jgi:hypothetical protein